MTVTEHLERARRLQHYLSQAHWDGQALAGPDCGVRFNYRVGRFLKSYLPLGWRDSLLYMQGQAYWVLANWRLQDLEGGEELGRLAVAASEEILRRQRDDGAWEYPNPEWGGRVATAEGTWAAMALVDTAERTGEERYLAGARAWRDFLETKVGYQQVPGGVAVNYFAGRQGGAVPNNSAFVLRFLGELERLGETVPRGRQEDLLGFLRTVQRTTGELPYELTAEGDHTEHFQCYQYNAFQCLDLARYYTVTGQPDALHVVERLANFLPRGVADDGHVYYDCRHGRRRITYHATAVAAALDVAVQLGAATTDVPARSAYRWALAQQRADGSFPFSQGDYLFLQDRRPYPRNLAMILLHLLASGGEGA